MPLPDSKRTGLVEIVVLGSVMAGLIAVGIWLVSDSTFRTRLGPGFTLVLVLAVCAAGLFVLFAVATEKKVVVADSPSCAVSQIPVVFERLQRRGHDGSFAVFMFQPPDRPRAEDAINVQFSVEGGRVGLDWCLVAPSNIVDGEKFKRLASSLGYGVRACEMNEVKYLRVEEGDLQKLCQKIICDIYGKGLETRLDMVVEGFPWP